jgi:ABC-type nitrate/sulfonate/bicarbonate transport system permease component
VARRTEASGWWGEATTDSLSHRFISVSVVAAALVAWYAITAAHIVRPLYLPHPQAVLELFAAERWSLLAAVGWTVVRMVVGFTIGSLAGIGVACLASWSHMVAAIVEPLIQVVKPIPPLALTAFAILWFGTGLTGIVAISAWACFIVLMIETREAIRNIPPIYLWAGAAMGASQGVVYRRIILPAVLPGIIGALRVAVVMAFNLTLLVEFRAGAGGVGYLLIRGYTFLRTNVLFAAIICTIATTLLVDLLLARVLRRLVQWRA